MAWLRTEVVEMEVTIPRGGILIALFGGQNPLGGLRVVQTVLDHLACDLICSPLIKHLLRTSSAIWLRAMGSGLGSCRWWCLHRSHTVWGLLDLYAAHEGPPDARLIYRPQAALNPHPFQQRSDHPEIDEAGRSLKAVHCGTANMKPCLAQPGRRGERVGSMAFFHSLPLFSFVKPRNLWSTERLCHTWNIIQHTEAL